MKISLRIVFMMFLMYVLHCVGYSQDCIDYHKNNCKAPASLSNYQYDQSSRSGLLMKGQSSDFKLSLYQGRDYRVTLCNQEALGENVQYQIVDVENNTVLYDNKEFNFEKSFEFSVLISREIKIVVVVPADDKTQKTNTVGFKPKPTQMGCVGVLIESMITPKKGF